MHPALIRNLSGGGDVQFSRPDFKIACQFGSGSFTQVMDLDGYIKYKNSGIRLLHNFYDTSTSMDQFMGIGEYRSAGMEYSKGNTNVGSKGWAQTDLWPYLSMLYVDNEITGPTWDSVDANDITFTAGNGGIAGSTITASPASVAGLARGMRLSGSTLPYGTYVQAYNSGTGLITMNYCAAFGSFPYVRTGQTVSAAVPNGSTITGQGRINEADELMTAVRAWQSSNGETSKLIGMYSSAPSGVKALQSYLWWNFYDSDLQAVRDSNDACGAYIAPGYDFLLPECYAGSVVGKRPYIDGIAANVQWLSSEKSRMGVTSKLFPLMQPGPQAATHHSYDATTAYLEYMIRCPEVDGCAFWMVDGTYFPDASPTYYDNYDWMMAIQDFISKYGLSL